MALAISQRPLLRLVVLCVLYLAQGIPHGFVTFALTAWLIERGTDTAGVALIVGASVLPWSFKWAWGPFVDRYQIPMYGRRRPWIIFAQCAMIVTASALCFLPNPAETIGALAAVIFIHNLFSGLQDVAVDALAVDLLRPKERGRANGLMYGSKYGGTAIGAAGLGYVLATEGLITAVIVMMLLLAAIMCVPIFIRERPGERLLPFGSKSSGHLLESASEVDEKSENASVLHLMLRLLRAFGRRNTITAAILGLLIWIPNGMVYPVGMTLFINDLGWTQASYTALAGTWGIAAGLSGSVIGGFVADLVGARKLAACAAFAMGLLLAIFGMAPDTWWESTAFVSFYLVAEQGIQGILSVSLFAIFMSVSWRIVAATQFTAYMALLNLSYTIGTSASPILEPIGVRNIFLIAAVFQMLVIVVLPFCTSWKDRYKELECTQCGYRLTGLEPDARCPECGHARQRTA